VLEKRKPLAKPYHLGESPESRWATVSPRTAGTRHACRRRQSGVADDLEKVDGVNVLNWEDACEKARKLVRGDRPVTAKEAIDAYEADLKARNKSIKMPGASAPTTHRCSTASPRVC
jgi:hypothetical protein